MITPPFPRDEKARLAALRSLGVLDTPPEERFDRYTRMARRLFSVPIALVSLIDADRQWFKSKQGLDASETDRAVSFCGHAILEPDEPLVVNNALHDERFHDNPLVVDAPDIRFYAGHPLVTNEGYAMGTLCIIDAEPRELDEEERGILADLASMVVGELDATLKATTDVLTGLTNRRGLGPIAEHALAVSRRLGRPTTLLYIDLDGFKPINDTYGHAEGDRALIEMAHLLSDTFRDSDVIARIGGDEFCALCTGAGGGDGDLLDLRLQEALRIANAERGTPWALAASVGAVSFSPARHADFAALMRDADETMYEKKRGGRR